MIWALMACCVGLGFMLGLLLFRLIDWEGTKEWLKNQIVAK